MSDIAAYDDGAVEAQTCTDGVFGQDRANILHRLVEVNAYGIAFASLTEFFGNQRSRVVVQLLDPDTVLVDFALDVAVGRAAYAKADRAAGTVTRQTNHAHVVRHILAAELCTQADLVCLLQQLFLQLNVAERTSGLVARSGQTVVEMRACQLNRQQVFLRAGTTDNDGDMIRRTSCRTQALHFLHEERNQRTRVLDTRLGFLVEIGLVGRTATLGHAEETVLRSVGSLQINLRRQVALGVHLVVHVERRILRITQVALGVGVIHTAAQCFLVR